MEDHRNFCAPSPDSGRFPAMPDDGRKLITQGSMNILNVNVACNHEPEHEYICYEYPDSIKKLLVTKIPDTNKHQ